MTDYKQVSDALSAGADPEMICMTCPWDRFCITPPTMTKSEIDKQIEESKEKDRLDSEKRAAEGKESSMPIGTLMTALMVSGKDTSAQICPVFALRLRSSDGQAIVADIRRHMKGDGA